MIALLGATGRIGRPLAATLHEAGALVRALVRDPAVAGLSVPTVPADLGDAASLTAALEGCDRLFLLTPHGPDQEQQEARALRAARDAGVSGVVKLSGTAVALGPTGPSSTTVGHWRTEGLAEEMGFDVAHLRPSFLMQNLLETAAPVVRRSGKLIAPFADEPIVMVDARDVADAAARVLLAPEPLGGRAWALTGPAPVTYRQIAGLLGVRLVRLPLRVTGLALRLQGVDAWERRHALGMAAFLRTGADGTASRAVEELTGRPARTIDGFLADHADAFAR